MILFLLHNTDIVKEIVKDPDIFAATSEDQNPDEIDCHIDDALFLCGAINGNPIGVMAYELKGNDWYCHPAILPKYRREHAYEFVKQAIEWFLINIENADLYAKIPLNKAKVINFAKKLGFILERQENDDVTMRLNICSVQ